MYADSTLVSMLLALVDSILLVCIDSAHCTVVTFHDGIRLIVRSYINVGLFYQMLYLLGLDSQGLVVCRILPVTLIVPST